MDRYCTEVRLDTPISQCESELIEEGFISTAKSAVDNMVTQARLRITSDRYSYLQSPLNPLPIQASQHT